MDGFSISRGQWWANIDQVLHKDTDDLSDMDMETLTDLSFM